MQEQATPANDQHALASGHAQTTRVLRTASQLTLQKIQQALELYLDNPGEVQALTAVIAHAKQMHGVFSILNETQAAALMDEIQAHAQAFADGALEASEPTYEPLLQAILQTPRYFEWLQLPENRPKFDLQPFIDQLQTIRLNRNDPRHSDAASARQIAQQLRPQLQRALVGVLRGEPDGLQQYATMLGQLRDRAGSETDYQIWWLAARRIELLNHQGAAVDDTLKLLMRNLDQWLKHWLHAESAAAQSAPELVQQLIKEWPEGEIDVVQLDQHPDYQPPNSMATVTMPTMLDNDTLLRLAELLKESITRSLANLDRFASNLERKSLLTAEVERLRNSAHNLSLLNINVVAELIYNHIDRLQHWQDKAAPSGPTEVLQTASELYLVHSTLSDLPELAHSERFVAALSPSDHIVLLTELERRRTHKAVIQEIISVSEQAHALTASYLSHISIQTWDKLQPMLHQISGALIMLGCERAAHLMRESERLMAALGRIHEQRDKEALVSQLADIIVTIERYLHLFLDNYSAAEASLDNAEQQLQAVAELCRPADQTMAQPQPVAQDDAIEALDVSLNLDIADLSQPPSEVATLNNDHIDQPDDKTGSAGIESDAATISSANNADSDMTLDPIDDGLNIEVDLGLDPPSSELDTDHQTSPVEPATAQPPKPVPAQPEQDPEMLEIFYEELAGELDNIDRLLPLWQSNPMHETAIKDLRRSFHTIKGSGRMVGEVVLGELAWGIEQILNQTIGGQLKPSAASMDTIAGAHHLLAKIVTIGSAQGHEQAVAEIVQRAEALLRESTEETEETTAGVTEITEITATAAEPKAVADTPPEPPAPTISTVEPVTDDAAISPPPPPMPMPATAPAQPTFLAALPEDADPELVEAFLDEATDILDACDFTLQRWNSEPDNKALINDLRREAHTLKGGARLTGLLDIGNLAHATESVMEAVAKGDLAAAPQTIDAIQRGMDGLSNMLARVKEGVPLTPAEDLIHQLYGLIDDDTEQLHSQQQAALEAEHEAQAQEFVEAFLTEADELLVAGEATLQRWRDAPENPELLKELRRVLHTIRGSSRLAGVGGCNDLSQTMNDLLDACASGAVEPSSAIMDMGQQTLAALTAIVGQIKRNEPPTEPSSLIAHIRALIPVVEVQQAAPEADAQAQKPAAKQPELVSSDSIRVDSALLNTLINQMGESSIYRARIEQGTGSIRSSVDELDQTLERLRQHMRRLEIETETQILFRYEESAKAHAADFDPLELDRFAELQQLSRSMMEIVDDLTSVRNTLQDQTKDIRVLLDQQGKVNKDIQQNLMRTGMVRFSTVAPRLRRVVRQVAQELGKRAQLILVGEEQEADRTVLDNMIAPLEHMLRNALSHGIETPEQRRAHNKPESGTITLSLCREGAELVFELSDDGNGINYDAIRAKGEEKGLLQPGAQVSEQELINLLLQPGFSTAKQVTQIAGRGVGMDVLHDAIKSMRGTLHIESETGRGTTFIVRLPFSLSVTQALLVKAGSETYAIPMLSLEAVDRLPYDAMRVYLAGKNVQHKYGQEDYSLHSLAVICGNEPTTAEQAAQDKLSVLLLRSAEVRAALQVDAILGHQEIIVKPAGPQLHHVAGVSGATVLADGRVVIVLELAALVRRLGSQQQQRQEASSLRQARQETAPERTVAMVIDDSITMRKVTARFLDRHDFDVKLAKDGMEAVAMLEEFVPDFAILDIEMPRMDGFEVVAHVRNQPRLKHLPIIMVTSRSGEKHRTRAAKLGVNDYLIKPYQEEELIMSIRKVLRDQQTRV